MMSAVVPNYLDELKYPLINIPYVPNVYITTDL